MHQPCSNPVRVGGNLDISRHREEIRRLVAEEHDEPTYCEFKEILSYATLGPPARGWEQVAATVERAASNFRDGEMVGFETIAKYVTPELAYAVWIERQEAKFGDREDFAPIALRVTLIFGPEDGTWKVVHRHADPITTARPAESVIQR